MKTDAQVPRFAMGMLLLTAFLIGCSKSNSNATGQAQASPTVTMPAEAASPAASSSDQSVSASASPTASMSAGTASPAASDGDQSAGSLSCPEWIASCVTPAGDQATPQATLPPPASGDVRPFSPAAALAAAAALPGSAPTQADAVAFALYSARDAVAVGEVAKDFQDEFAAHRNADRYLQLLKSSAKPMGLSSVDIRVYIEPYDFNTKSFPITSNWYGNGQIFGAANYNSIVRYDGISGMPDGSTINSVGVGGGPWSDVRLDVANDNRFPTSYPLDPDRAETFQKAMNPSKPRYSLTQHIVFYPIYFSRPSAGYGNGIVDVVRVTKVSLEQRPSDDPTAVPTILMSTDLQ